MILADMLTYWSSDHERKIMIFLGLHFIIWKWHWMCFLYWYFDFMESIPVLLDQCVFLHVNWSTNFYRSVSFRSRIMIIHDDAIKWKYFPLYWRSPVNSPHKGQWRRALMWCLTDAWINGWINHHKAGDLSLKSSTIWQWISKPHLLLVSDAIRLKRTKDRDTMELITLTRR